MVSTRTLSSGLGFTCMLGGALFGMLVLIAPFLSADGATVGTEALGSMVTLALLFLVPGGVALYLVQRPVFGRPEQVATAVFLVGLAGQAVVTLVGLFGVEVPGTAAVFVVLGVGQFGFGVATAYHDVLAHGRSGGILLAVALPVAFGGTAGLQALGVEEPLLYSLMLAVPVGAAWILLGLDLLTAGEGGVRTAAVTD